MSTASGPPDVPTGPVQLNGWKEIAAYLGRSVRTVQRWEKDFGLPVRRFGVSKPESVFALPREVDNWLETAQGISARSGAGAPDRAGGSAAEPPKPAVGNLRPLSKKGSLIRIGVSALITVGALATLWMLWSSRQPGSPAGRSPGTPAPAPAEWRVDLDTLVVSDAQGAILWKYRFPNELVSETYKGIPPAAPRALVGGVADVDGDGTREVWLLARFAGELTPANTALYLFEHDGRLRWKYVPSGIVRFGADTFGPSWIVDRVFVTPDPAGGRGRALWAVTIDAALFPSQLQRLDPQSGKPLSTFWSDGYIVSLALDLGNGRRRLFLGACNNEHRAGSLAVLDALNPNGSAPSELEKYRCTSCPPGGPDVFLVFPKGVRFGNSDRTGPVFRITTLADGGITLGVLHAATGDAHQAVAIYTLDAQFNPRAADSADDYLNVYRALVAQGAAPAGAPATIDADREFFPILRWDRAARRYEKVFLKR